jgi:hypothetical protein
MIVYICLDGIGSSPFVQAESSDQGERRRFGEENNASGQGYSDPCKTGSLFSHVHACNETVLHSLKKRREREFGAAGSKFRR